MFNTQLDVQLGDDTSPNMAFVCESTWLRICTTDSVATVLSLLFALCLLLQLLCMGPMEVCTSAMHIPANIVVLTSVQAER